MLQDQILCTRLRGSDFITQHGWVVHFRLTKMVRRKFPPDTKWSGGNILYQLGTSSQRANGRGRPLNIFT
jgi:hypothetical protein